MLTLLDYEDHTSYMEEQAAAEEADLIAQHECSAATKGRSWTPSLRFSNDPVARCEDDRLELAVHAQLR